MDEDEWLVDETAAPDFELHAGPERSLSGARCSWLDGAGVIRWSYVSPHAFHAAEAAESAAAQGRFWEMHDRLYENQQRLRKKDLLSHRRRSGSTSGASRPSSKGTLTSRGCGTTS
jgi:hypothetical protein